MKSRKKTHCAELSSSSPSSTFASESSDSEGERETETLCTSLKSRWGAPMSGRLVPPFTVKKDTWTVWFAWFEAIADNNEWPESKWLSLLLSKLQGAAGKYLSKVVSQKIWSDYRRLVCKVLEGGVKNATITDNWMGSDRRQAKVSKIWLQKLKRLYDKDYPNWDHEVCWEDLLNLFFGALVNDDARRTFEFIKDPHDIEEAVDHVVY